MSMLRSAAVHPKELQELLEQKYTQLKINSRSRFWDSLFESPEHHHWFSIKKSATSNEQVILLKIPQNAIGHTGIAHGGLIATLLDESLCYAAYPLLPHHTGVTASLNISYLQPTPAGSWVLMRALAVNTPGSRKVSVDGYIYKVDYTESSLPWETDAKPLVSANQVVIEPKWYLELDHSIN